MSASLEEYPGAHLGTEDVTALAQEVHNAGEAYRILAATASEEYDPTDEQFDDDRILTEYAYALESVDEAIQASLGVIRGELSVARDTTVTVLTGQVHGESPSQYFEAAAAIRRDTRRDGHLGEDLRFGTAADIASSLRTSLGVIEDREGVSTTLMLSNPDGSMTEGEDRYLQLTPIERLRLSMYRDLFVSRGEGKGPTDSVGNIVPSSLRRILDDMDGLKPLPRHLSIKEIRDVLPSVVAYGEYKMYQWHYMTGCLGETLGVVEGLVDIDPATVHSLDLQPMAERLIVQAAAYLYDTEQAGAIDRIEGAYSKLEQTRGLLKRVCALQAWQAVTDGVAVSRDPRFL